MGTTSPEKEIIVAVERGETEAQVDARPQNGGFIWYQTAENQKENTEACNLRMENNKRRRSRYSC